MVALRTPLDTMKVRRVDYVNPQLSDAPSPQPSGEVIPSIIDCSVTLLENTHPGKIAAH